MRLIINHCSKKAAFLVLQFLFFSGVEARDVVPPYAPLKPLPAGKAVGSELSVLNEFQRRRLEDFIDGAVLRLDTLKILAIQVQFADSLMGGQPGSRRPEKRDSLFFANELKHLGDYFQGASRGHLSLKWEILPRLYNLPKGMGYYGDDEKEEERVVELVQTLIDSADGDVDFSDYHTLFIIHAGAGQETDLYDDSREEIWSSFYDRDDIDDAFPDSSVSGLATGDSLDGEPFLVDNFVFVPANASQDGNTIGTLGIWAFQVGNRIGLLRLFDSTPSGFPDSRGAGNFCLMSYGLYSAASFVPSFPCAFNRLIAGWVEPLLVEEPGRFRLRDINSPLPGDTSCLKVPISESEYYLVVNRVHDTNFDSLFTFPGDTACDHVPDNADSLGGAEFDFFLTFFTDPGTMKTDPTCPDTMRWFMATGSGLYIWHIDEGVIRGTLQSGFLPNDFASHKGVDLEEADGIQDLDGVEDIFSFGGHYDSFRKGHNDRFDPRSDPSSSANSGVETGISIYDISEPSTYMECDIAFSLPYEETSIRWTAQGYLQPPTPVNLQGGDTSEVVVFADTGLVYIFKPDGREFLDRDGDPSTVEPYLEAPGALWVGPGAFGDIDGVPGPEIVVSSSDGRTYAWRWDGSEVADGDRNPATQGVLYKGSAAAAPPMLIDVDADGINEVAIVEMEDDTLFVSLIDRDGNRVQPADAHFRLLFPAAIPGQYCAPLSFGACGSRGADGEGVVVSWLDTLRSVYGLSFIPVKSRSEAPSPAPWLDTGIREHPPLGSALAGTVGWTIIIDQRGGEKVRRLPTSPPAVGDLDADGFDEVVLTMPDGRVVIYARNHLEEEGANALSVIQLEAAGPSSPSLGDVDRNGTLEIALWDTEYYYVLSHNGRYYPGWPKKRKLIAREEPPRSEQSTLASPLIGDINGDGKLEIAYPSLDGALYCFGVDGGEVSSFPRLAPAGVTATPSVADLYGGGELSLLLLGSEASIVYRDPVSDSLVTEGALNLSIQSLPGSSTLSHLFWPLYQHDLERRGRVSGEFPLVRKSGVIEEGSFIIYPNPVEGGEIRARIILNRSAEVRVEIYNLEGERVVAREFQGNPGDLANTPFDEAIDVSRLRSGVYFLRLRVEGPGLIAAFVKTFAIRR